MYAHKHSRSIDSRTWRDARGMSFIDVIIGIGLMMLIFMALYGGFELSMALLGNNKALGGATALANEQVEYLRSLPYDDVATQGGIPLGSIPQIEQITLNAIEYTRRTLIQYVDDPADGVDGAGDTIPTDYKRAKVELSWTFRGKDHSMFLVTNIVPRGVETNEGGGTLRINVFDALGAPVSGADVHVENASLVPAVDVVVFTDVDGIVTFYGAPAASEYQVTVTKAGYSTAQTYDADAGNPNPIPAHLTVIEDTTTSASFAIDELAQKTVRTFTPPQSGSFTDEFTDTTKLAETSSTTVSGGALILAGTAGNYAASGTAVSIGIAPAELYAWGEVSASSTSPAGGTSVLYRIAYEAGGSYALVPDVDLPGNSAGFAMPALDLSGLSAAAYPDLRLEATLSTTDPSATPEVRSWSLSYEIGPVPLPNIPFTMQGSKTIGTDSNGLPVYKYNESLQTNGSGELLIDDLEWDAYSIAIGAAANRDISSVCDPQPRAVDPGEDVTTDIFLVAGTAHSLRIIVRDDANTPLSGAAVTLNRTGYNESETSDTCGQVFFPGLTSANDYVMDIVKSGYVSAQLTEVSVDGDASLDVVLISP